MRKFLTLNTSLIILISLFLPSLAFADVCAKNCHPVTDDIQAFDDYLNGKFDPPLKEPWIPGNAINELLQKSLANAKKWHPDAYLVNFTYTYAPGSEDNYQFYWASPSNPTKMYEEKNSQSVGEEKDTIYKNSYGIFRVPLTMRRLTTAMLKSPTILPQLDALFMNQNQTYISVAIFSLQKNSSNKLGWTVTFIDELAKKTYLVKVDAENIQNPTFNILQGKPQGY